MTQRWRYRFGYQPQRDALLIYWQAVKLLWKGATFYGPPSDGFKEGVSRKARHPKMSTGESFRWQPAKEYPWTVDQ